MAIYRQRPTHISAVQWKDDNADELTAFAADRFMTIDPEDRTDDPDATAALRESHHASWVLLHPGQWVLKASDGDFSALDDEEFRARYEAVEEPPVPARPTETDFVIERHDGLQWLPIGYPRPTLDEARQVRDGRRVKAPADRFRILEWTATARVIETDEVPAGAEAVTA
ncbi:hypothetical protein ACH40F_08140 [Streptomyces sp. NPDC020794]|uniref:hypothetical protein n=1 Tax=unclassified Streptomyces TaxID=2593676 RepID=UPI0036E0D0DA